MNVILSIILFPVIWILMYLYRIVIYDFLRTLLTAFTSNSFPSALFLIITLPFVMIVEIPVALIMTLITSVGICYDIFRGEIDIASAIKLCFQSRKR